MNKNRYVQYVVILMISMLSLTGCAGLADYDIDLPGDYSVVRTSAHEVFISPKYVETGGWGERIIPTKVTEVAWDENYILAKQQDLKDDPKSSTGYQIPDEKSVHYWILDFLNDEVIGPLDVDRFKEKQEELQIADDIVLRKVGKLVER